LIKLTDEEKVFFENYEENLKEEISESGSFT
jgi:hypothetical protein